MTRTGGGSYPEVHLGPMTTSARLRRGSRQPCGRRLPVGLQMDHGREANTEPRKPLGMRQLCRSRRTPNQLEARAFWRPPTSLCPIPVLRALRSPWKVACGECSIGRGRTASDRHRTSSPRRDNSLPRNAPFGGGPKHEDPPAEMYIRGSSWWPHD